MLLSKRSFHYLSNDVYLGQVGFPPIIHQDLFYAVQEKLKEKNIPVYFEKESINTVDSKGEVLLTIMASLT